MSYHDPVLLHACADALEIKPDGTYVDVTFGGGGHSREILRRLGPNGRLFAFDQDTDAAANLPDDNRLVFIQQNFRFLKNFLKLYKALPVDGILADLGVSSHQFDEADRGFSIRFNSRLDMRMDPNQKKDAVMVLNEYSEADLKTIFREYGEIRQAGRLARLIVEKRAETPITESAQLLSLVKPMAKWGEEHQLSAQVFQAIRIEVNDELESLKQLLIQSAECLSPGGLLVVLSYHSLEDRLMKNFIRSGKFEGEAEKDLYGNVNVPFTAVNRKPIRPTGEEIKINNRARSALLRVARKNG